MKAFHTVRRIRRPFAAAAGILGLTLLGACDTASDPLAPESTLEATTVVTGQVTVAADAGSSDPGLQSGQAGGVTVTFEGLGTTDSTRDDGTFRVEGRAENGTIRIRFTRGPLEGLVVLEGITPGATLRIEVTLTGRGVSVTGKGRGFDGYVRRFEVSGAAPERTLRVLLVDDDDDDDREAVVEIDEGDTRFHPGGDILTFERLVAALEAGREVEIEGYGERLEDGSYRARKIEVDLDDDDDRREFEGDVTRWEVSGDAPGRILSVLLVDDDDRRDEHLVRIRERETEFHPGGDILTFQRLVAALEAEVRVEIEGRGPRLEDGSYAARIIKAEVEDD